MNRRLRGWFALAAAFTAGLTLPPAASHGGTDSLGISEFRIDQTPSELRIVGLDSGKAPVGTLRLKVNGLRRELRVEVGGRKAWHKSQGQASLHLPLLSRGSMADVNAFLRDSGVSSALQEWGITVGPLPGPGAADQPSHACTFAESLSAMGTSCCEMPAPGASGVEEFVCGGYWDKIFIDRICTKPSDPDNPCGATGPNGCSICWTASYTNDCRVGEDPNNSNRCAYAIR